MKIILETQPCLAASAQASLLDALRDCGCEIGQHLSVLDLITGEAGSEALEAIRALAGIRSIEIEAEIEAEIETKLNGADASSNLGSSPDKPT